MSSYDRHGYINNPKHTGITVAAENEKGYINDQDLKSSEDYETPDYDSLNNSERDRDKHVYHGLDLKPDSTGTSKTRTIPHPGFGNNKENDDPLYKKSGQRKLIVIVVVLIVVLVTLAATFGVLYFKRTEDSSETTSKSSDGDEKTTTSIVKTTLPVLENSPETTQELSTPPSTISTTTSSSPDTTTEPLTIEERCQVYDGLIPHPQECQAYYNCSYHGFIDRMYTNFEPFLLECPYPQLFNTVTMACEHFEHVTCGYRKEAKQGCDYRAIRCTRSHCRPCYAEYPTDCAGKEDGFHGLKRFEWSPYFINCYKERYVAELRCPDEPIFGTQLFSPEYRACVGLDRIPPERGGMKPNCTGKEDGLYPNEYGRCTHYTECVFGQYKMIRACPESQVFDEATKTCSEKPTSVCICSKTGC